MDNKNSACEHKMERIWIDRKRADELENQILIGRHIERYTLIRKFIFGRVLDTACGVGYGSYMLAKNPDVKYLVGVDCDEDSINYANSNFASDRVSFICDKIEKFTQEFDFLVSLETIEHLEEPVELYKLAVRCNVKEIIVSFPHKKTTHYNKYHLWDLRESDILDIFQGYECIHNIENYDSTIMHLIKRNIDVIPPKRYYINIDK